VLKRRISILGAAFVSAIAAFGASSCRTVAESIAQAPAVTVPAPAPMRKARRGGTDVTFLAISDTHFGYGYPDLAKLSADPRTAPMGLERENLVLVSAMNTIEGKAYPAELGGFVGRPRGVLAAGDLTEWGRPEEWRRWVTVFGKTGTEGALELPIFEAVGNHDKVPGPWLEDEVAKRHGGRHYSWNWDDLHVVSLGDGPDDAGLLWLERDLDKLEADVPIVLYFHFPLDGENSTDNWFGLGTYRERLAKRLVGRNVIGIFHGHNHAWGTYLWHGIDVYDLGAVKDGPHIFTIVHVKDTTMQLATYNYDSRSFAWSHQKALPAPRPFH